MVKEVDQITVVNSGVIMVREVRRVMLETEIISETYHRYTLNPGDDIADQPDKVKQICEVAWNTLT